MFFFQVEIVQLILKIYYLGKIVRIATNSAQAFVPLVLAGPSTAIKFVIVEILRCAEAVSAQFDE